MAAKSDVQNSRHRHLHATIFRRFAEESVTSGDAEFMLRSKIQPSIHIIFVQTNPAKITFFDDEIFFLLFDMNQKIISQHAIYH